MSNTKKTRDVRAIDLEEGTTLFVSESPFSRATITGTSVAHVHAHIENVRHIAGTSVENPMLVYYTGAKITATDTGYEVEFEREFHKELLFEEAQTEQPVDATPDSEDDPMLDEVFSTIAKNVSQKMMEGFGKDDTSKEKPSEPEHE